MPRDNCLLTTGNFHCARHYLDLGAMSGRWVRPLMTRSNVEVDHVEAEAEGDG